MAKCYILASMSNVLQHQMQDVELASDLMLSLKEMFLQHQMQDVELASDIMLSLKEMFGE